MAPSKAALVTGGVVTYLTGTAVVYFYLQAKKYREMGPPQVSETERQKTFDSLAPIFDEDIDLNERLVGIRAARRELLSRARGSVLEVGVGTARNLEHYGRGQLASLTMVDFSEGMLDVARSKYAKLPPAERPVPGEARLLREAPEPAPPGAAHLMQANSAALPFADNSFDTVVDTFGLCSFETPLHALLELRRVVKRGGEVLLLEHGRSTWGLLNDFVIDPGLGKHVKKYGCFWNRDIEGLVRASGLEVVSMDKMHLGTTVAVVARKRDED